VLFGEPMSKRLSPATLQAARLSQCFSLADLGGKSGISSPTLSRIENGARDATPAETERLAAALSMSVSALCRSLISERLGLSGFYHRKLSRAGSRAVSAIENQCLLDVVAFRELIGMVHLPYPQSVITVDMDDVKGDPEKAAEMVRLAWQVPRGPIQDLCAVVERAGCFVIHSDFGISEVDALYQKAQGVPPIFWVNSRKPMDRVRWNIAHELGHLVMHEERPINNKMAEDQANQFAAAFLMPRSEFRGECPTRLRVPELVEMKRRWRCSMIAILWRAHSLKRISDAEYKNTLITLSKNGWRKVEPYPITGESPKLLSTAVRQCLNENGLTEEELADRIGISVQKVQAWQQPFPGQRPNPNIDQPPLRLANGY